MIITTSPMGETILGIVAAVCGVVAILSAGCLLALWLDRWTNRDDHAS